MLVRERLGTPSLLGQGVSHKVKKKRHVAPGAEHHGSRPGTAGTTASGGGGGGGNDTASLVSGAYTYRTATTFQTHASQPDFMRIPAEYDKVKGAVGVCVCGLQRLLWRCCADIARDLRGTGGALHGGSGSLWHMNILVFLRATCKGGRTIGTMQDRCAAQVRCSSATRPLHQTPTRQVSQVPR